MDGDGADRGLNPDGTIAREGSLHRVDPVFAPVVAAARERVSALFGDALHGAYLYGSVPRGGGGTGRSEPGMGGVLREKNTHTQREGGRSLENTPHKAPPQIP
ncbi:nucleotidyltransferase, partial [Nocardiopsis flavescens]